MFISYQKGRQIHPFGNVRVYRESIHHILSDLSENERQTDHFAKPF